jgi:flagellar hook protein FlgE
MSFQQGLSGLNATAKALDTIGNNVSNSGTVGYKSAVAQFQDVYAASLGGGGASQIGIGASLSKVAQQFTQGNITNTNNALDLAINGAGMYRMVSGGGTVTYSRAGQFQLDKTGYVVSGAGLKLTGYTADPTTGTISPGDLVPLQVTNTNIAPKVTTASKVPVNLDSRALPPSAMSSGSLTGAKTLGASTVITAAGNNNVLDLLVDGQAVSITIPDKATGYAPSELVTSLQSMINSALSSKGLSVTVSNSTGGYLMISSSSKGSVGALGQGSSVALNGAGGTAATTLFGAPTMVTGDAAALPTALPASMTGGAVIPTTSVILGSGESFTLTTKVGGVTTTRTISLAANAYTTSGAGAGSLQNALQQAIDPAATTWTVTAVAGQPLSITQVTPGTGDTVAASAFTSGFQPLFGPTTVAGADNFNTVSGQTSGTLTASAALSFAAPIVVTAANSTFNLTVDGFALNVPLTATLAGGSTGSYDGVTAGQLATDLAANIQTDINNALIAAGKSARVTVSLSAGKLTISSNSKGSTSSVALSGTNGALISDPTNPSLFGAAPVVLAGNQTQTVNPLGFTSSTAQTVYDSQGNPHNLALYFVKTSEGNAWQLYTTLDSGQQTGPTLMTFDGNGALQTPMPITLPSQGSSYLFRTTTTNASAPNPLQFTLDLSGSTQYGVSFNVNSPSQDGYSSGQLSGISVGAGGIIQGRFSNGQSKNMGQIVLVSFNNQNGLQSLGGNQWAETAESGQPNPGMPGTGSLGLIQSSAVEESNVDLTKELVDMITQQRVYQANAQTIKTQDQVLQTLVNLR